jgi:hypothetical protein
MIYAKTDKGRVEVADRQQGLSPVQRRLLIVVDGRKTRAELGAFVRVDEIDAALEFLHHEALIETTVDGHAISPAVASAFSAGNALQTPGEPTFHTEFLRVRGETSRFVLEHLGASGAPICAAIDRCDSPFELRKLLHGVEIFVGERLSPETTQAFARHFGALLL